MSVRVCDFGLGRSPLLLVGELDRSLMDHRLTVGDWMVSLVEEDYRVALPLVPDIDIRSVVPV